MQVKKRNLDIDIVIPWVDGSDPIWQASKRKYSNTTGEDNEIRYRDWGLLKYVFRGIEQNLPWVRKVHFITCGHLPEWLNMDCAKLHIVKHSDYIPGEWLPTFSSHPIELNIHRIQGLSEHFIYQNDDMYYVKPMKPDDFFQGGKPVSQAGLDIFSKTGRVFNGILYSDLEVINRRFYSRKTFPRMITKFINPHYGFKENFKTIQLASWCIGYYPGFSYFHGPNAFLKRTLEEAWEKEYAVLAETSAHKFRQFTDVNQFLFLWWQWNKGDIVPRNIQKRLKYIGVDKDIRTLCTIIENSPYSILCLNDAATDDFEDKKEAFAASFEKILGRKSMFEL